MISDADSHSVSVVIPSVSRPSVEAAVVSALTQDFPPLEVIVVLDREHAAEEPSLPADARIRVLKTGGGAGPSAARMIGVQTARGTLVAFLDDDDVWAQNKLSRQVAEYARVSAGGLEPVVSCRAHVVMPGPPERVVVAPKVVYDAGESDVADYLFVRRTVRRSGFTLGSSTLLCSRVLLEAIPWDSRLRLHEDWDWVLRACRQPGVILVMLREPLARYVQHPATRTTASRPDGGWDLSAAWARQAALSPRALGDFLLTVAAPQALQQRRRDAALNLAACAVREGRPGIAAWVTFLLQFLPSGMMKVLDRSLATVSRATDALSQSINRSLRG